MVCYWCAHPTVIAGHADCVAAQEERYATGVPRWVLPDCMCQHRSSAVRVWHDAIAGSEKQPGERGLPFVVRTLTELVNGE